MKQLFFPLLLSLFMLVTWGCQRTPGSSSHKKGNALQYSSYVSAYSAGMQRSGNSLRIELVNNVPAAVRAAVEPDLLFDFSPNIRGEAVWVSERVLEFIPGAPLKNGTEYKASFAIGKVVEALEEGEEFEWMFRVIDQVMSVELQQVAMVEESPEQANVAVRILTSDFAADQAVEECLSFEEGEASWEHRADGRSHLLTLSGVKRLPEDRTLEMVWSGKPLGLSQKGTLEALIPGTAAFHVLAVKPSSTSEPYLKVVFSDVLDANRELDGLFFLTSGKKLTLMVEGNTVELYPKGKIDSDDVLVIDGGVRSRQGMTLGEDYRFDVHFSSPKPAIRWVGEGAILPDGEQLVIPFEAVNLSAVDVTVVKIYASNVVDFFQDNNYSSAYNLKRNGRIILKERIALMGDQPVDQGGWNTYRIDLSKLMKADPGSMYRVKLNFDRSCSTYPCEGGESDEKDRFRGNRSLESDPEYTYYDNPSSYYYDDSYYGDDWWEHRDDPCFRAYYNDVSIERNLLASNLGVVVKRSPDDRLDVFVHDILTSKPLSGASVSALNYQKQVISSGTSDAQGAVSLPCDQTPFLVVASLRGQKGYLKIQDGESLSLSRFDVSGKTTEKGLKGFLYGERGVWRPGDTLYLSFMLDDKSNPVPQGHPVLMELFDPLGRMAWQQVQSLGRGKLNTFVVPTQPEDVTGTWNAKVTVGGAVFNKRVRIETLKPNRLRIRFDLPDTLDATSEMRVPVRASYLHGAKASNLKFATNITLKAMRTSFPAYRDYLFFDPSVYFDEDHYEELQHKLDANGTAVLTIPEMEGYAPGFVRASLESRVYEKSGEFSVDYTSVVMSPFTKYVGLHVPGDSDYWNRLETDKDIPFDIVTVDDRGNPVATRGVEVSFYKVKWSWWYEEGRTYASLVNNRNFELVREMVIDTKDGEYHSTFRIPHADWGRYLIYVKLPHGHATAKMVYVDWPEWNTRKSDGSRDGASLLSLVTDKEQYRVGDRVALTFPGTDKGTAIITLENGSGILHREVVSTFPGDNVYYVDVTKDMTPNIYACVHLLQPHSHPDNDLPLRLYGVIPIMVDDPATKLTPVITMKKELRSKEKTSITLSEKLGRPLYYTLAVVDEGLLSLTNYRTPAPYHYFYAREALGVKTWDMYDEVIGAFTGNMASLFAIGGDENLSLTGERKKRRFKPVVKFYGPYELGKGEQQQLELQLPEYVGAVRVMAVASSGNAYGTAQKEVVVRDPLMVHATMPRVLAPGEIVEVPVTVFAMDRKVKKVSVSLSFSGDVSLVDGGSKQLTFEEEGEKIVRFKVKAGHNPGNIGVEVVATSGREKASQHIDLSLRNPNPQEVVVESYLVPKGGEALFPVMPVGDESNAEVEVEVASVPTLNTGSVFSYMMRYPHGCAEQSTSAGLVQMLLPSLLESDDPDFAHARENVVKIIAGLRKYQKGNGGMATWPGGYRTDPWVSCYVGHFLSMAADAGYAVPKGLENKLIRYLSRNSPPDIRASKTGIV